MCELFGLNSNTAARPHELLCRFGAHGGESADNRDGWGIAWHTASGFEIEKEPEAAATSRRFGELCAQTRSSLILAHVRSANPPTARVRANTHPFRRVCCGHEWVFAHNGIIPDSALQAAPDTIPVCTPMGSTDSEHAFCMVLDNIARALSSPGGLSGEIWLDTLVHTAETLASRGRFNFLMSDGKHLIAYGHDRLHSLENATAACCGGEASALAIIATEPLTPNAGWRAFAPGEMRVYRDGRQIARFLTRPVGSIDRGSVGREPHWTAQGSSHLESGSGGSKDGADRPFGPASVSSAQADREALPAKEDRTVRRSGYQDRPHNLRTRCHENEE